MLNDLEVVRQTPFNAETPLGALSSAETSVDNVYVRSNFDVPRLDAAHRIEVVGAVDKPMAISLSELEAMPQFSFSMTMECAGNDRITMLPLPAGEPWQNGALSTVRYSGVSLAHVLQNVGLGSDAVEIVFRGADRGERDDAAGEVRFERSLSVERALGADVILALQMNGEPLTAAHGAPVRVVVPGWYGMASVKWLDQIRVLTEPFQGYFQSMRYVYDDGESIEPVNSILVKSIIIEPRDGAACSAKETVRGWAWSGNGAIVRVEVAVEGGEEWADAELGKPASTYAWTPWSCEVSLRAGSRCTLRSRATDASGATQPAIAPWNRHGYGNNAVRPILVQVN